MLYFMHKIYKQQMAHFGECMKKIQLKHSRPEDERGRTVYALQHLRRHSVTIQTFDKTSGKPLVIGHGGSSLHT